MIELYKETILSMIITELAAFEDVTEKEFFLKYEKLFEKYTDITKLKEMLEKRLPLENWEIIERAKRLAFGNTDSSEKQESMNPLCSIFSNLSLDGTYPEKKMYYAPAKLSMENTIPLPGSRVKGCHYCGIVKVTEQGNAIYNGGRTFFRDSKIYLSCFKSWYRRSRKKAPFPFFLRQRND